MSSNKPAIAKLPDPEWSYRIEVEEIPAAGWDLEISPSAEERKALAKRFAISSVDDLRAGLSIHRENGMMVKIHGHITGRVTQPCVVTLDPVAETVDDEFEAWFADQEHVVLFRKAQHEAMNKRELVDLPMLEEDEDPEPIENGQIDLGELVAQYFSLAINPYPHKAGVNYEKTDETQPEIGKDTLRPNPFAALKNWRPQD